MSSEAPRDWSSLLVDAVTRPGTISSAYSRFWNYSVGNQILALFQCLERDIEPGPIHTFKGWLDLGRHVKKGEKAITLCMPVLVKRTSHKQKLDLQATGTQESAEQGTIRSKTVTDTENRAANVTIFTFKSHWFVLSQTDGNRYQPQELPAWSESRALNALSIDRMGFQHPNGNCQGYALERGIAVSPIAALPHKTLLHEVAHVLLGHTAEGSQMDDHEFTPRNLQEVEAECVTLICCESLGLPGIPECRGYIQHWLGKETIPDRSAQRIFRAADQILRAGRSAEPDSEPDDVL
jgi:antirestriction protein ArdC